MKVSVLADANWQSKVEHAIKPLTIRSFFESRDYGESLKGLVVVLMCRESGLAFKQRIRYKKAAACLYMDVMFSLDQFVCATHSERRKAIASALVTEVPKVIEKRSFKNFEIMKFKADFERAVTVQLLGSDASIFDADVLERASGT